MKNYLDFAKNISLPSIVAVVGTTIAIKGLSATTVVAGATAAAGAIKTTTVITSAGPMVLSVVKASLFAKIFTTLVGGALVSMAGYWIYLEVKDFINSDDKKILEVAAKTIQAA